MQMKTLFHLSSEPLSSGIWEERVFYLLSYCEVIKNTPTPSHTTRLFTHNMSIDHLILFKLLNFLNYLTYLNYLNFYIIIASIHITSVNFYNLSTSI